MRILIASPQKGSVHTGNRSTALQWARIFEHLGHQPAAFASLSFSSDANLLVALHAEHCHEAIQTFRKRFPNRPIILGLSGTDIYPEPSETTLESIARADALVVLQDKAVDRLPARAKPKTRVIVQSAESENPNEERSTDPFRIVVAGHLREVKDPMRAAVAARALPPDSRIRIEHAGAILEAKYRQRVDEEQGRNPRYHFHGELPPDKLRGLMRRSQATVLSSRAEGGARVIGETVVDGTPPIASRIDGVTGLLGDNYPALFPVGDTKALTDLMSALERDAAFRTHLREETKRLASRFAPALEREAWKQLIDQLTQG